MEETGSTSTDGSTSGSSSEPTSTSMADSSTGEAPTTGAQDPCACADPQVVEGDLDVPGLDGFAGFCIGEVTGRLEISGVTDPAVLQPLAALRRVERLWIRDNPGLVDVSALGCLEEITDELHVRDNPALVDLGALTRVRVAPSMVVENSPIAALPSFAPDYQGMRWLYLLDLPELVDLDPLAGWGGVLPGSGMNVNIVGAARLESVAGLAGPMGAPGTPDTYFVIELDDLPALESLTGLEALRRGELTLSHLPKVTSLAPLAGLEQAETLWLRGLPGLTSLEGLHGLVTAYLLDLGGCGAGDGLPGLADLTGLDALTKVEGRLSLVGNAGLVALTGAPALTKLGQLDLVDNPKLGADAVAAFTAQAGPSNLCSGGAIECGCLAEIPAAVQDGCAESWSGGSAVTATGPGGPLTGATAFFGWRGPGPYLPDLNLVVVDVDADLEAAKADGVWGGSDASAPKLVIRSSIDYQDWIGVHTEFATLSQPGAQETEVKLELTVSERLGDWTMFDPADPPRLIGELSTAPNAATVVQGPFDAVFCADFVQVLSD